MKKAALLLCTLAAGSPGRVPGWAGRPSFCPRRGNITAIQVETLEGESLSLTQEEDIARLLEVLNTGWSIGRESVQDQPLVEYGTIRLENRGGATVLYYYKEGDATVGGAALHPAFSALGGQPGKRPAPARLSMGNQERKVFAVRPWTRLPYKPPSGVEKEPADRGQRPRLRVRLPSS